MKSSTTRSNLDLLGGLFPLLSFGAALQTVARCRRGAVVELLLERGCDENAGAGRAGTPLHEAAAAGNVEVVRLLLARRANVHIVNSKGWTPLHSACAKGEVAVAMLLCEAGADCHAASKQGTPLALLRAKLAERKLLTAEQMKDFPNGRLVRACGIVTMRQQPETASGVIFVTLEDETGMVNVIVWPKLLQKQRREFTSVARSTTGSGTAGTASGMTVSVNGSSAVAAASSAFSPSSFTSSSNKENSSSAAAAAGFLAGAAAGLITEPCRAEMCSAQR
jgi:hypothetical protein